MNPTVLEAGQILFYSISETSLRKNCLNKSSSLSKSANPVILSIYHTLIYMLKLQKVFKDMISKITNAG